MGDPKQKRKKYNTPGHPYEQLRLETELKTIGTFGLRNKRELWNARTQLRSYRQQARQLLALDHAERELKAELLVTKLIKMGILETGSTAEDVLALHVENILKRRLQTVVHEKGLATTVYHARQLIVHRHIKLNSQIANIPSLLVPKSDEEGVSFTPSSPYSNEKHPMLPINTQKTPDTKADLADTRRNINE